MEQWYHESKDKLSNKERDVDDLKSSFLKLEKQVELIEGELLKSVSREQLTSEEREKLEDAKAEFNYESGNVVNDQLKV